MGTILIKVRSMKRKTKLKDGYYFRIPKETNKSIEKDYLDSMVIVTNGKVKEFFQCYAEYWVENCGTNYTDRFWHLEFMGDL